MDVEIYINEVESRLLSDTSRPNWMVLGETLTFLERSCPGQHLAEAMSAVERCLTQKGMPLGRNQIGKIHRVYRFLEKLAHADPKFALARFERTSIVALEIAHRLHGLDEAAGLEALVQLQQGASVSTIDRIYKEAKARFQERLSPKSIAAAAHEEQVKAAIRLVRANGPRFVGLGQKNYEISTEAARSKTGVTVDFVAKILLGGKTSSLDGFDVVQLEQHPSAWSRRRAEITFRATFFRRFWLMLICESDLARFIVDELDRLQVTNAGVALLAADYADFEILSCPKGEPSPDRRLLQLGQQQL